MSFIQEIVLRHRGAMLHCLPVYGWGWSQVDTQDNPMSLDFIDVERAGPFKLKIRGFMMDSSNSCLGFAGEVIDDGHWLHGDWAAMECGGGEPIFDLKDNPPMFLPTELYSSKYLRWAKYGIPEFPACHRVHGEVRPTRLVQGEIGHDLEYEQFQYPWEHHAWKRLQNERTTIRPVVDTADHANAADGRADR